MRKQLRPVQKAPGMSLKINTEKTDAEWTFDETDFNSDIFTSALKAVE